MKGARGGKPEEESRDPMESEAVGFEGPSRRSSTKYSSAVIVDCSLQRSAVQGGVDVGRSGRGGSLRLPSVLLLRKVC